MRNFPYMTLTNTNFSLFELAKNDAKQDKYPSLLTCEAGRAELEVGIYLESQTAIFFSLGLT